MKTFKEKLVDSFNESIKSDELNKEVLDFLINKIAEEAVEYDMHKSTDPKLRAKAVTNSLLTKGEESNL